MTKLSRSKLELFTKCPRCFWLDVKMGIKRPQSPPYTINSAIDYLLKQEFDEYRRLKKPHPIMATRNLDAVPFDHPDMDKWRHNFTGVQCDHKESGFHFYGAVDDIWITPEGELMVVDYKSTGANQHHVRDEYKRQMEIYQWLLERNGFTVLPRGYFVYARVNKGGGFSSKEGELEDGEHGVLPFDIFLESYDGDRSWVSDSLLKARKVYDDTTLPSAGNDCEYCAYVTQASDTPEEKRSAPAQKTVKRNHGLFE